MKYYSGGGYRWEPGEVPKCTMCEEETATRATAHSGIILCESQECWNSYITQECAEIELMEDGTCEKCKGTGTFELGNGCARFCTCPDGVELGADYEDDI